MFVELENTVEGLVRLANMADDYYIYDEMTYTIIGERTKKTYKIGDPVRIQVDRVNVDFREIDFELVGRIEEEQVGVAFGGGRRDMEIELMQSKRRSANELQFSIFT